MCANELAGVPHSCGGGCSLRWVVIGGKILVAMVSQHLVIRLMCEGEGRLVLSRLGPTPRNTRVVEVEDDDDVELFSDDVYGWLKETNQSGQSVVAW